MNAQGSWQILETSLTVEHNWEIQMNSTVQKLKDFNL